MVRDLIHYDSTTLWCIERARASPATIDCAWAVYQRRNAADQLRSARARRIRPAETPDPHCNLSEESLARGELLSGPSPFVEVARDVHRADDEMTTMVPKKSGVPTLSDPFYDLFYVIIGRQRRNPDGKRLNWGVPRYTRVGTDTLVPRVRKRVKLQVHFASGTSGA